MATKATAILSFSLSFLLLCHAFQAQESLGAGQQTGPWQSQRRSRCQLRECRIERLSTLEPTRRIESEAGFREFWEQEHEQLQCAGVTAHRTTIQPRGLLLPTVSNAPVLVYILQGTGITASVMPGCPETYHSFQQTGEQRREQESSRRQSQRSGDQHQKVHRFRQGDIIAHPAGVATWSYNDGDTPVVAIVLVDTSNSANQLDRSHRPFLLAGSLQSQRGQQSYQYERQSESARHEISGNNVFYGFDVDTLSEVLGVSKETARRLQSENDRRGNIVRVQNDLQVLKPSQMQEEQQQEQMEERERGRRFDNGFDESFCYMNIRHNIDDASRADVFSPRAGRLTSLNSQKLPILRYLRLSAERGVLYRNAIKGPNWSINAHSIVYVTRGRGRVQIVGNRGQTAFNDVVRRGQLFVVPQNFAVLTQAGSEGFEYVSFKTNDNAMSSPIVGKASVLRGMPEEVLMSSYRISREEARRLKFNRGEEKAIFSPSSQSQTRVLA